MIILSKEILIKGCIFAVSLSLSFFAYWRYKKTLKNQSDFQRIEKEWNKESQISKYNPKYSQYDEPSPDFLILKNNTKCPFAKNSIVMSGEKWDSSLTLEENVRKSIPLLLLFNQRLEDGEDLDGFLIEIEQLHYGETLEELSKTVKRVLTALSDNDPTGFHSMDQDLRSSFWNFTFGNMYSGFFVSVLAPCYESNNSRHNYGSNNTFILLQPEMSFHEKAIKLDYDPKSVRHLTRKRFIDAGQRYDHRDSKQFTMCNWIVRPHLYSEPSLKWWEVDIEKERQEDWTKRGVDKVPPKNIY